MPVYCCVRAAWDNNYALVNAALDTAGEETFALVQGGRTTFQNLLTGLATLGDPRTRAFMNTWVPLFGITLDTSLLDNSAGMYLAAHGDADLDGVCNLSEYKAFVTGPDDFLGFVLAALDPAIHTNPGYCGPPCYGPPEGESEGQAEGQPEGQPEGLPEGQIEGGLEGQVEGVGEGQPEGLPEGEGTEEGPDEGYNEGMEGGQEGDEEGPVEEGQPEGSLEEGLPEGVLEGEGIQEGLQEGIEEGMEGEQEGDEEGQAEGEVSSFHTADQNNNTVIELSELLRIIQFFNSGGFHCQPGTEDGYAPGPGDQTCPRHASDYNPHDWRISLSELLRLIQFFNSGGYRTCGGTEDGFCPGVGAE